MADAEHLGLHLEDGELTVQSTMVRDREFRDFVTAIVANAPLPTGATFSDFKWNMFMTGWQRLGMAIAFDQPAWEC